MEDLFFSHQNSPSNLPIQIFFRLKFHMKVPSSEHITNFIKFHWNSIFSVLFKFMKNRNYILFINCFLHKGKSLTIEWPKLPPLHITELHTCIYYQKT